jgi:hypothetical protein
MSVDQLLTRGHWVQQAMEELWSHFQSALWRLPLCELQLFWIQFVTTARYSRPLSFQQMNCFYLIAEN